MEKDAEGRVTVGFVKLYPTQAVDEVVTSGMKGVGVLNSVKGTTKTCLQGLHYEKAFLGNEMRDFDMLNEMKLAAREIVW